MAKTPWSQFLSWIALALFVVVALLNASGAQASWWFVLPVGIALVALVVGVRARRRLDVVVSALVVLAIPVWLLGIIVLLQFAHPLSNNSFSP
jgi:hypothetical protein